MAKRAITFDTVREIALRLPGVEDSTTFGQPALKIRGKLMACIPSHKSAEPDSLLVRVDFDDRADLLAADPDVYYVKEHYVGYAGVLVRLPRVSEDILRDLLGMAHKYVTRNMSRRAPARSPVREQSGSPPRTSRLSPDKPRKPSAKK